MVIPIVDITDPNLKVWGQKQEIDIPLPKNPWLRRRRLGGAKYEVERLYAKCGLLQVCSPPEEALKTILTFLSSEYKRNEVYYAFIRMPGIRRVGWWIWKNLQQESRNADAGLSGV